jgi:hypothetical protein
MKEDLKIANDFSLQPDLKSHVKSHGISKNKYDSMEFFACPSKGCKKVYISKYSLWRHLVTHNPKRHF